MYSEKTLPAKTPIAVARMRAADAAKNRALAAVALIPDIPEQPAVGASAAAWARWSEVIRDSTGLVIYRTLSIQLLHYRFCKYTGSGTTDYC